VNIKLNIVENIKIAKELGGSITDIANPKMGDPMIIDTYDHNLFFIKT
jgi:hypothetical protein